MFSSGTRCFFLMAAVLAAIPTHGAFACAACDCTLSRDWDAQGITNKQGFSLDLSYDVVNQNQLWVGTRKASGGIAPEALAYYSSNQKYPVTGSPSHPTVQQFTNNGVNNNEDEITTISRNFGLGLGYTGETWGVNVVVPYINRYHSSNGQVSTIIPDIAYSYPIPGSPGGYLHEISTFSAMGDIRALARYSGFSADNSMGFLYGIKLPTGSTSFTSNAGSPLDRSLQPGTGSTDVLAGGYITGSLSVTGWFAQALVQHAVFTTGDYRPGDTISANAGFRYGSYGQTLVPMLQLNFIHRAPDTGSQSTYNHTTGACSDYRCIVLLGDNPAMPGSDRGRYSRTDIYGNRLTGGQLAYLAPGLQARLGSDTTAYAFIQLPVYRNVNSLQLTPGSILSLGIRHYL